MRRKERDALRGPPRSFTAQETLVQDDIDRSAISCRAILLLLVTALALTAPAAAKSWRVSDFQDTITVQPTAAPWSTRPSL